MRLTVMSDTISEEMKKTEDHIVGQTRLALREIEEATKARREGLEEIERAYSVRIEKANRILSGMADDFTREEEV